MHMQLGAVTLGVADAERSMTFYRDLVGLRELSRSGSRITLGAAGNPVLHLLEERGDRPAPTRASGLYHTAILFPDRAALARTIKHITANEYPFRGASDHLVSEAFYLDDPDGLGVELYRDRPRGEWRWRGSTIEMDSLPLDVPDLLASADQPFDGAPAATRVGHVHLKVSGIAEAEAFYQQVLGFDVTARLGDSATFLAADGYHHHIGANVWHSLGASAAPAGFAGLREIVIDVPATTDVDTIAARAAAAGRTGTRTADALVLRDPWGQSVCVRAQNVGPPGAAVRLGAGA